MGRLHSKAPAEALGLAVLGEAQPAWSVRRKRNKEGFADRDISPCTTALSCPQFVTTAGWTLARVGRWPVQVVQSLAWVHTFWDVFIRQGSPQRPNQEVIGR